MGTAYPSGATEFIPSCRVVSVVQSFFLCVVFVDRFCLFSSFGHCILFFTIFISFVQRSNANYIIFIRNGSFILFYWKWLPFSEQYFSYSCIKARTNVDERHQIQHYSIGNISQVWLSFVDPLIFLFPRTSELFGFLIFLTLRVTDEGYYRNVPCALNSMFTIK